MANPRTPIACHMGRTMGVHMAVRRLCVATACKFMPHPYSQVSAGRRVIQLINYISHQTARRRSSLQSCCFLCRHDRAGQPAVFHS